jgi:hypothetical protein
VSLVAATWQLAKKLEGAKGYTVLNATPFFDSDVVAVTNATAKKFSLKSISDLKKAGSFKFGGFPECKTRNTCFIGYTKQYGITNATFTPLAGISAYAALDAGKACSKRFAISRIAVRLLLSPSCNSPAVNNQVDACGLGPTAFASGLSRMWRSCG